MSRYIDAVSLIGNMMEAISHGYNEEDMLGIVNEEPTVNAVEVVRCENCFYGKPYNEVWYHPKKNSMWCKRNETEHEYGWFCADGEKVTE